jgi:predicted kinase|tara:strand:+ start:153 stop:821 length:669 start_codon:yes stop_codon:yes gene_type:complete
MLSLNEFLKEGINDPSIFKAVFLAGGPGSGKSFMIGQTALTSLGFKLINSDPAFELALSKAGLKPTPDDIASPKGQELRGKAKTLVGKQMDLAIDGRLGLVIDGTGKDFGKIKQQADALRGLGYSVSMIFVNTDLKTALSRNAARARSLPDSMVSSMWQDVQKNIGKFQNFFASTFIIVDNSEGANAKGAGLAAYKKIKAWAKKVPTSHPKVKQWMDQQRPK